METPAIEENRNKTGKSLTSILTASVIVLAVIFLIVIIVSLWLKTQGLKEVAIEKKEVSEQVDRVPTIAETPVYTKTNDPNKIIFGYSEPCGMERHSYGSKSRRIALRVETDPVIDVNGDLEVELGSEHQGKMFSYPVILGGLPIGGEEPSKTFASIYSIYDEAGGLLKTSQWQEYLHKGDMVLVCLPTDIYDAPPPDWEFWSVWFYPQKEKLLKYRNGMQALIESSVAGGKPPDPNETTLYVTEIVVLDKIDLSGIGIE